MFYDSFLVLPLSPLPWVSLFWYQKTLFAIILRQILPIWVFISPLLLVFCGSFLVLPLSPLSWVTRSRRGNLPLAYPKLRVLPHLNWNIDKCTYIFQTGSCQTKTINTNSKGFCLNWWTKCMGLSLHLFHPKMARSPFCSQKLHGCPPGWIQEFDMRIRYHRFGAYEF